MRKKERAGLVRHRTGDERLARPGRPVHEDALGRLDANGLEELWVPERQFHQLPDLRQLLLLILMPPTSS
ncbi:hypothetical protein PR202_ga27105 [Eleusine coracana subsp. coracana]|uniref:Uncharacterized protein n=1 Tax=Eleusine coracana subsp. coracana TaxID=191504 RepID=A0AAV5DFW3_ELECO|nr:hypothetical protein PR202_ga27105 [Eleusine coracana subsp. coracana]